MPPLRELYDRSEQALEASLLASSSEYMPGDSKRRLTGLLWTRGEMMAVSNKVCPEDFPWGSRDMQVCDDVMVRWMSSFHADLLQVMFCLNNAVIITHTHTHTHTQTNLDEKSSAAASNSLCTKHAHSTVQTLQKTLCMQWLSGFGLRTLLRESPKSWNIQSPRRERS